MAEHMKWLNTADGIPTFEEVEGKTVLYHRGHWGILECSVWQIANESHYKDIFFGNMSPADWYIIIDPPEEEPLEYGGFPPKVMTGWQGKSWIAAWISEKKDIRFYEPTRAAVITAWNQFVRSIKETK